MASETQVAATRRDFMKAAALVAATAFIGTAPRQARGANEKLGVGFIGTGGRCGSHFRMVKMLRDNEKMPLDLVAACDVYRPRLDKSAKANAIPFTTMDYRELLASPKVDVVCIATPDHWHARQAIDALKAGKHIYCEKPITHWQQFDQLKELAEAVEKSPCAFQVGTQAMSDSVWRQMKQLVKEGLIGKPFFGETSFFRLGDFGERGMPVDDKNAQPGPDLNWDAWLGDRPKRPFNVDRLFRWRLFEEYAGGPVTDIYPHCATQIVDILGVEFPEKVVASGGVDRFAYELRDVPDAFNLIARYPGDVTISVLGSYGNAYNSTEGHRGSGSRMPIIRGFDGTLTIDKNNKEIVFAPQPSAGGTKIPQKEAKRIPIEAGENNIEHWKNLIECAQKGTKNLWSPMNLAYRTQTMLIMAMQAYKNDKTAKWDAKAQKIVI